MPVRLGAVLCVALLLPTATLGADLKCDVGPVTKTYGKTSWLVYSCHNDSNIVIVTAPGNPAMPFVFQISVTRDEIHLTGEGTGRQDLTDAAYKDLNLLSVEDIAALVAQTKTITPENPDTPQNQLGH